jgi:hypothetical protein
VLVLLTYRSDELHRLHPLRGLLGELTRNRRVRRLELRRLSRDELAEQLAGLVGEDPPAGLVGEVYARSEGSPFFAEEPVLAGDGAGPAALPPSLQEVLPTRVVRLGRGTQQVLAVERAREQVAEAVPLVEANPRYAAPLYVLGLRIEADRAELAGARRPGGPVPDDGTAAALLERLGQAAASQGGAGLPDVGDWHTTALAERNRFEGRPDPAAWAAAAAAWERLGRPYRVAYAGFRQAEALMAGDGDRDAAAEACAVPPRSPPASAPAPSTPRSRSWPSAPASAWTRTSPLRPPRRRPRPSSSASPRVRLRSWRWSRPAPATARSLRRCSSAPRRPASTSPTSWPSSASPPGSRPPPSPTASAWTECAPGWPVKIRRAGQVI